MRATPQPMFFDVLRLRSQGLILRDIAELTGVSTTVVSTIYSPPKKYRKGKPNRSKGKTPEELATVSNDGTTLLFNPISPYGYCATCRNTVKLPCLVCQLRNPAPKPKSIHG